MSFVIIRKSRRRIATPARVNALSKRMDAAVKLDFLRGVESFKKKVHPEEMLKAFMGRDYSRVVETVPWRDLGDHLDPALQKLGATMREGAVKTVRELPIPASYRYSLANPKVERYVKRRTGELITTSEAGMLEAVRAATSRSLSHGLTPQQVADEIRDSIGLNAPQARALANYRSGLANAKNPRPPEDIEELASTYRERLLDQRATMIGRTEVRFAMNAGQQDVWEAAAEDGFLPENAERVWIVDGDPCKQICLPMRNVAVGIHEPWVLPDNREVDNPSESHPNCYCLASLRF